MEIKLVNVTQFKKTNTNLICVLKNINYCFTDGNIYLIYCQDDSKNALIDILSLLKNVDEGTLLLDGVDITRFNDKKLSKLRQQKIGVITKKYNFNPNITLLENMIIASILNKRIPFSKRKLVCLSILEYFHLDKKANSLPHKLTNLEKQLASLSRALINNPNLVIFDYPETRLNVKKEQDLFNTLKKLTKKGKCIIIFTNDRDLQNYADINLELSFGNLIS